MSISEINRILKTEAVRLGLCDKWRDEVWGKELDLNRLAELYFKGSDFVIEHHYPSNASIKALFERDFLRQKGILVDDKWSLLNPTFAMVLGKSESKIRLNAYKVSQIYVRDDSHIEITARHHSHAIVHLYENAAAEVSVSDNATVRVLNHAKNTDTIYKRKT